jgi:CheY-like chemotaxis protein
MGHFASRRGDRILVVDDEADVRDVLRLRLEHMGYKVDEAQNCKEAVERARQGGQVLCLLDIMMPGTDGIATLREIRLVAPELRIVFVTASVDDDVFARAMQEDAHVYGFINKPVFPEDLERLLVTVLEKDGKYLHSR